MVVLEWELDNAAALLATAWAHDAAEDPAGNKWRLSYALFCSNHRIPPSRIAEINRRAAERAKEFIK